MTGNTVTISWTGGTATLQKRAPSTGHASDWSDVSPQTAGNTFNVTPGAVPDLLSPKTVSGRRLINSRKKPTAASGFFLFRLAIPEIDFAFTRSFEMKRRFPPRSTGRRCSLVCTCAFAPPPRGKLWNAFSLTRTVPMRLHEWCNNSPGFIALKLLIPDVGQKIPSPPRISPGHRSPP